MVDALTEYLELQGLSPCGLIHDALLFSGPGLSDLDFDIQREAASYVSQRVGYPVRFAIKAIHTDAPLPPPREVPSFPDVTVYEHEPRLHPIRFWFREDVRCFVIAAPLNMGKTHAVVEFIAANPRARFLVISTKILHAITSRGALAAHPEVAERLVLYLDGDRDALRDPSAGRVVIVQNESLHKLLESHGDLSTLQGFDYVICDETRSLVRQMVSEPTHRGFLQKNLVLLQSLCLSARCVFLCADVFWDRAVAKFCLQDLGGLWPEDQIEVHKYTLQTLPRTAKITFDKKRFQRGLRAALDSARAHREATGQSRPVLLNCMCKARLERLLHWLFPDRTADSKLGDHCAYWFTGDSNDGLDIFDDINAWIRENAVDLIAHSPKLTVGASINEPVTAVFCDAKGQGCVVRDWGQGCGRARNVDGLCLHVLMAEPVEGGAYSEQELEEDIEERLEKREQDLLLNLEKFYPGFEFVEQKADGQLEFKSKHAAPQWVRSAFVSSFAEQDRTRRNQTRELLRLFQFRGWPCEYVDLEHQVSSGFFLAEEQKDEPRKVKAKRRREEQEADSQAVKRQEGTVKAKWARAHAKKQKLKYKQIVKDAESCKGDRYDKETAVCFQHFPETYQTDLKPEHVEWYSKHRAALFHARTLKMTKEEIENKDLTDMLFAFRNKTLLTSGSVQVCLEALDKLLFILKIPRDKFVDPDADFKIDKAELVRRAEDPAVRELCMKILGIVWAHKDKRREGSGLALIKRVFAHYGRLLFVPDWRQKANEMIIALDANFAFLYDIHKPQNTTVTTQ